VLVTVSQSVHYSESDNSNFPLPCVYTRLLLPTGRPVTSVRVRYGFL
jgi:hypothetical protein